MNLIKLTSLRGCLSCGKKKKKKERKQVGKGQGEKGKKTKFNDIGFVIVVENRLGTEEARENKDLFVR